MPDSATLHHADADNGLGQWRNVFVVFRRGKQTLDTIQRTSEVASAHTSAASPVAFLHVYSPSAELPDQACRDATAAVFQELRDHVACSAVVFEGVGRETPQMRNAVRALTPVLGGGSRRLIAASVEHAAHWIAQQLGGDAAPSGDELLTAIEELRKRYEVTLAG